MQTFSVSLLVSPSRSWNQNPVYPSVEVLKPRSRLSIYRCPETQISVCPSVEVLKPRSRLSVCRGPKTQIPSVRLSRSWNPDPKLKYPKDSRTAKVWKSVPRTWGPKNYSGPHIFTFLLTKSRVLSPDQSRSQVPTPRLQITYWGAYGQRAER
jgi:hypothetical protein